MHLISAKFRLKTELFTSAYDSSAPLQRFWLTITVCSFPHLQWQLLAITKLFFRLDLVTQLCFNTFGGTGLPDGQAPHQDTEDVEGEMNGVACPFS